MSYKNNISLFAFERLSNAKSDHPNKFRFYVVHLRIVIFSNLGVSNKQTTQRFSSSSVTQATQLKI
jgi:hypothetical protein